jgi:hypothetical protein
MISSIWCLYFGTKRINKFINFSVMAKDGSSMRIETMLIRKTLHVIRVIYTSMDQITIKTPDPKCRLYCCLIEFIDWRYSQSCWYFRPLL